MGITVINRFPQAKRLIEKKAQQFVQSVAITGAGWAKQFAPIEYGTLINSQDIRLMQSVNNVYATVGFYTNYAVYLETNKDWRPRPSSEKAGPGYNPDARPGFLKYGFEGPEAQADIQNARRIMKI